MSELLVDLGNTRLKWARRTPAGLVHGSPVAWRGQPLGESLDTAWAGMAPPAVVWIAAVAQPGLERELAAAVTRFPGTEARFVHTVAEACGVHIAYARPERLGVDRLLAMIGAHARRPRDQLVVSVGTALTADVLAACGAHRGGIIAPAPALMRASVLGATARVVDDEGRFAALPRDTAEGLHTGCLYAAAGAVDRLCAAARAGSDRVPAVVLCGGGAPALAPLLPGAESRPALVLEGLAAWLDHGEPAWRGPL